MTFRVHATTNSQQHAAAICLRLQDEGLDADYGTAQDLGHWADLWPDSAHLLRSAHEYFVIVIQDGPYGAR